jgi:HAD superfamily hydrolase (TIGR01490 family)
MSKKFAVFDIDGTIFRWQLYHELFDAFVTHGIISPKASTVVLSARENWRTRSDSYTKYEHALIDAVEPAIIGLDETEFHAIADDILRAKGHQVYRYTSKLLANLKTEGYLTIALSASHHELVERFCTLHGIDIAVGRKYEIKSGKVTEKSTLVYGRKAEILRDLITEHNLDVTDSYAVGDSASDIEMLAMVTHPIAFNPNTELKDAAMERGWPIVVERKDLAYRIEKGSDGTYILAETNSL